MLQAYGPTVLDSDDTETARQKIEAEIRRLPTATWAWEDQDEKNPLGNLRVWQVLPGTSRPSRYSQVAFGTLTGAAVREHEQTGRPAFFNNVVSRFLNAVDADTLQPPHLNASGEYQPPAFYGDGSLIPREYLDSAVEIIK